MKNVKIFTSIIFLVLLLALVNISTSKSLKRLPGEDSVTVNVHFKSDLEAQSGCPGACRIKNKKYKFTGKWKKLSSGSECLCIPNPDYDKFNKIRFIKVIGAPGTDNYLAISQFTAIDTEGNNVAKGKSATSSTVFNGANVNNPLDGVEQNRDHEQIFVAGKDNSLERQWWQVDLGKPYNLKSISIWNRNRFTERLMEAKVQFLDEQKKFVYEYTLPKEIKNVYTLAR
jgi:hypothetical protein